MSASDTLRNGWNAVPLDAGIIFGGAPFINTPEPLLVNDIHWPSKEDPVVAKIQEYAKETLSVPTYNHCMRVYYFVITILKQQFPDSASSLSPSTVALTCLLHDLGTASEFISTTRMSFEFYGAYKAMDILKTYGVDADQAEAVAECIIRHQDLGTVGTITFLGQLIQLATIYDNVGEYPTIKNFGNLIHEKTRDDVNKTFPRLGWLGCFANTIRQEKQLKPWCHSTHIANFEELIEGNTLMKPYE